MGLVTGAVAAPVAGTCVSVNGIEEVFCRSNQYFKPGPNTAEYFRTLAEDIANATPYAFRPCSGAKVVVTV